MQIIKLEAENFKRIEAVVLDFPAGGGVFEVAGKNGQGKSSAIDAIWAALGGKEASPDLPLRKGSLRGSSSIDLGEYRVSRVWKADGGTQLVVTDAEGGKVSRPQEVLDGLFSRLAFDPMEFCRQTASKQAETLRRITGLDFTAIDRRRTALAEERKRTTSEAKAAVTRAESFKGAVETEPVDVKELNARIREANERNAKAARAESDHKQCCKETGEAAAKLERLEKELAAKIAKLKAEVDEAREDLAACEASIETATQRLVEPIDPAPLYLAANAAEDTNRKAARYQESIKAKAASAEAIAAAQAVRSQIEIVDAERAKMLAEAKFPVPGLSMEGDLVTFGGVPFNQVSTSEKIRVSLAVSAALNPKLRLVVVYDGSLLDDDSLAIVAEWAAANSYQVLVERVAKSVNGVGVVIEEGRVKEPVAEVATA